MSAEELLLSNTALLSEETGGGRLDVSWQVVQYVPLTSTGRVQSVALADCVGASAELSTWMPYVLCGPSIPNRN